MTVSAADLRATRKRLDTLRRALEAKAALGHSGSATPRDVAYSASLLLAELPIDPDAAEHRLALKNALPPNWKAA